MSLGWVKKKPGSRVDVVVGGKGGGKGERRGGEEWKPGQRWERRDLVTWEHSQQSHSSKLPRGKKRTRPPD